MHQFTILASFSTLAFLFIAYHLLTGDIYITNTAYRLPAHASATISRCQALAVRAGPPDNFHQRSKSDRFVEGTKPVLIKRAKIWTGLRNGTEVIRGDILIENGIFKSVGPISRDALDAFGNDLIIIDAKNSWITPGIVDIHSHLGDAASPALDGAEDDNSLKGTIQPWLRSLDGLNTHDDTYPLSVAGGVTTSLVLPGSANAIGMFLYISVIISDSLQVARPL